ncbi:TDT family transporter [Clostridium sp. SM-530-WT-3G]|uniref:TDT family transporter n=1 Tax=Clostridium sp. SM-530-WT-3G TaxID=2725303 RepID=UPI00145FB008|nr:TDT family transporter [Clostridium sp. SM-530-WT-3G]NME82469.1 TDT family transporter [Clostridium sp. SM-530-WT-3G]
MSKTFFQKLENIPVPLLPTMVGACTLSNVYASFGYTWVRDITMIAAAAVLIAFLIKIIFHTKTVIKEYNNTVLSSLYAGYTMIMMILGAIIFDFAPRFGKALWLIAIALHAIHILVFTYRNVLKGVDRDTFVPSWFVTYNGIMVSTVLGGVMNEPLLCKIIVYYGIAVFVLIIPFMIYRLAKYPIKDGFYHTQAVVLAPSSLCVVGYINFIKEPNLILISALYIAVLCALAFIIYKLPKFFSFAFYPGFAGITFPMAIGIFASLKMSGLMTSLGYETLGYMIKQLSGIQIYMTTAMISYVLYNFLRMPFKKTA